MSHDHELQCRACGRSETGWNGYHKYAYDGDALVENALAVKALAGPVQFHQEHATWAGFVAEHASCNAFWVVCEYANYGDRKGCVEERRILVKGAAEPSCATCHDRRLVPCPDCPG